MRLVFVFFISILNFGLILCIFKAARHVNDENEVVKVPNGFSSMLRFPYAVKIFSRENQQTLAGFSCSGSIVHHLWVVTAAHCVYGFNIFDVFIGNVTNDANHVVRAGKAFIHPNYTFDPELAYDIALLKLKRSLETLNNTFEIISMPQSFEVGKSLVGLQGIVAGYGKLGDSGPTTMSPNWARYEIISLKQCENFFAGNFTDYSERIICGRGIGASTCSGDSGQALVVYRKGKGKIVGIVSNGYESCETMGEPEIFTRVDGCIDFIEDTIKGN